MEVVIEREQAREQLENMQRRFEESVAETQQRIAQECDIVRREGQHTCQQLEDRVNSAILHCQWFDCFTSEESIATSRQAVDNNDVTDE